MGKIFILFFLTAMILSACPIRSVCAESDQAPLPASGKEELENLRQPEVRSDALTVVSLEDCITLLLSRNFPLKEARETLLRAESSYYNAMNDKVQIKLGGQAIIGTDGDNKGVHEMDINGQFTYRMPQGDTLSLKASGNKTKLPFLGYGVAAEYRRPLAKGFGDIIGWQDVRAAKRTWTIESVNYFLSKQKLTLSIVTKYFRLIQAQRMILVNQESVKTAKENLDITRKKFNERLVPKIDLSRAEINLLESEDALIAARKSWYDQRDSLLTELGLDPRLNLDFIYDVPYEAMTFSEELCIQAALEMRRELLADITNLEQTRENLLIAKNDRKPQIDLIAKWDQTRTGSSAGSDPLTTPSWTAGLEYSIDINRRRLQSAVGRHERGIVLGELKIDERKRSVMKEVRDSLRDVRLAENRVIIKEENLKVSEERYYLATRSWDEGIITNREMIDAQQALVKAQSQLVEAQIDYIISEYTLKSAMGIDLAALILQHPIILPEIVDTPGGEQAEEEKKLPAPDGH